MIGLRQSDHVSQIIRYSDVYRLVQLNRLYDQSRFSSYPYLPKFKLLDHKVPRFLRRDVTVLWDVSVTNSAVHLRKSMSHPFSSLNNLEGMLWVSLPDISSRTAENELITPLLTSSEKKVNMLDNCELDT